MSSARIPLRAFYGGTFDPPQLAHHEIVLNLLKDSLLDSVHLVPAKLNPLKTGILALGSTAERKEWLELWSAEIKSQVTPDQFSKLHIEWHEIDAIGDTPSYTVDSLEQLAQRVDGKWVLIGGADLLPQLSKWKDPERLLKKLHSFWIYPRANIRLEDVFSQLDPSLKAATEFRVLPLTLTDVSSTQIRDTFRGPNASQKINTLNLLECIKQSLQRKLQASSPNQ